MTTSEIDAYYRQNLSLLRHIAHQYDRTGYEYDDLLSEATIGFMLAVKSYDATKGTKLSTYIYKCAHNQIKQLIRRDRAKCRMADTVSLDAELELNDNEVPFANNIVLPDAGTQYLEAKELAEAIERIRWTCLNQQENDVLQLHLAGKTQMEIAAIKGISQAMVSKTIKKVKEIIIFHLRRAA